jgi:hypothetical protein
MTATTRRYSLSAVDQEAITEKSVPTETSKMNGCVQCGSSPLPDGRTRFCSDACVAQWKRESERDRYGHRHRFECVECGRALHLGRRKK